MSRDPEPQAQGQLDPPRRVPPTAVGTMMAPPPRRGVPRVPRPFWGMGWNRALLLALAAIAIQGAAVFTMTDAWWSRAAGASAMLFAGYWLTVALVRIVVQRREA